MGGSYLYSKQFPLWWLPHCTFLGPYSCTLLQLWVRNKHTHRQIIKHTTVFIYVSVLTIYVCVLFSDENQTEHLSVYLGKTAINDTDFDKEQSFIVEKLIVHQGYSDFTFNNDIGKKKVQSKRAESVLYIQDSKMCLTLHFSTIEDQKQSWRMCREVSVYTDSVSSSSSHSATLRISV